MFAIYITLAFLGAYCALLDRRLRRALERAVEHLPFLLGLVVCAAMSCTPNPPEPEREYLRPVSCAAGMPTYLNSAEVAVEDDDAD